MAGDDVQRELGALGSTIKAMGEQSAEFRKEARQRWDQQEQTIQRGFEAVHQAIAAHATEDREQFAAIHARFAQEDGARQEAAEQRAARLAHLRAAGTAVTIVGALIAVIKWVVPIVAPLIAGAVPR